MTLLRLMIVVVLVPVSAFALPNMIRLGYPNCASCHVSPQGGGILTVYGKGIDEAQSRRAGEYAPSTSEIRETFSLNGRIDQDLRGIMSLQLKHTPGGPYSGVDRYRIVHRNVTTISKTFRVSAVIDAENIVAAKRTTYDPAPQPSRAAVRAALVHFKPKEGIEVAAGRDALPTGLNIPDQTTFIKSRNRLSYYETPEQAKFFLWSKRWHVASFAFVSNRREPDSTREKGAGVLGEYDLLGGGKTVLGFSALRASSGSSSRDVAGVYARLGFGRWGVLAEHDLTMRELRASGTAEHVRQHATYAQVFLCPREWLAVSGIAERLSVSRPHGEELWAYKGEVSMRLSSNWTIGVRSGVQRNALTHAITPIASIQLAAKTVN